MFDGLASQSGGLVTVGVINGKISIVTSSIVGVPADSPVDSVSITAAQALQIALAGVIHTACADGNYDTGIVGHEIGHGIQHRMTGGPDTRLGGDQGGAMGESWGDLTGMEYQVSMGVVPVQGENIYSIDAYVLASPDLGIRNYNMSNSPLYYADGYGHMRFNATFVAGQNSNLVLNVLLTLQVPPLVQAL